MRGRITYLYQKLTGTMALQVSIADAQTQAGMTLLVGCNEDEDSYRASGLMA